MASQAAHVKDAMDAHRFQLARLGEERRTLVASMINIAKANGSVHPQSDVADLLGISQQAVSKIVTRKPSRD